MSAPPPPTPLPPPLRLPVAYPVLCGRGVLATVASVVRECAPAHRVAVITDTTVAACHGAAVTAQFPEATTRLVAIPPGEQEKTRARWAAITDELLAWGAGRDTTVVAVGGGVITDLAGLWNAPTRFFPCGVSTAVFPPTAASTMASRVVGTCTTGTPRR